LTGRSVVVIEDIVDTGNTLVELKELFKAPKHFKIATFQTRSVQKKISRLIMLESIPNKFIVGFGLDYDGLEDQK
jgi:hypoxanthine phosphoribosyltransferase